MKLKSKPQDMKSDPLSGLDLKPGTKEVLVALAKLGRSPAADIAAELNKPKSSVYDGLDELIHLGLVIEESENRARVFSLTSPEQIGYIKTAHVSLLETAFKEIARLTENRNKENKQAVARPRIRFYAGIDGIRQAFRDMPWKPGYRDAYLMWPMKDMIETLGEPFFKMHGGERFKYKVMLHSIRKDSDRSLIKKNQYDWLKDDKLSNLREVRYAPKSSQWSMSFWVYGDQTLFAGIGKERFAFTVRSREFADLMTLMWKQMWVQAKK